jgi:hypothetical protein
MAKNTAKNTAPVPLTPVRGWPVTVYFETSKEAMRFAVNMGAVIVGVRAPNVMRSSRITGLQIGAKKV